MDYQALDWAARQAEEGEIVLGAAYVDIVTQFWGRATAYVQTAGRITDVTLECRGADGELLSGVFDASRLAARG